MPSKEWARLSTCLYSATQLHSTPVWPVCFIQDKAGNCATTDGWSQSWEEKRREGWWANGVGGRRGDGAADEEQPRWNKAMITSRSNNCTWYERFQRNGWFDGCSRGVSGVEGTDKWRHLTKAGGGGTLKKQHKAWTTHLFKHHPSRARVRPYFFVKKDEEICRSKESVDGCTATSFPSILKSTRTDHIASCRNIFSVQNGK